MGIDDGLEDSARLRRMETKLHRLCTHLQVPDVRTTVPTVEMRDDKAVVKVYGHDTTLSAIKRAVEAEGVPLDVLVRVEHVTSGRVLARVIFAVD